MIGLPNHFSLRPTEVYRNEVKETSYVESLNAALRDGLARLKRKSKAYSKLMDMLTLSVELWMYKDMIRANVYIYDREK